MPLVAPLAVRILPRLIGTDRIYGYLAQLRIHYWASDAERRRRHGRRHPVVGRRLPWTGDNFGVLRSMTWQVHGYGIGAEAIAATAAALGIEGHRFGPDPRRRIDRTTLLLVRPDGFVAAAAPAPAAIERFRPALAFR